MTDVAGRLANLSREERALLFERLREKREGERRGVPRTREEGGPAPLSFAQQRLWFLDRLAPGSPLYNVPTALHLAGPLDPAVLAACFGEIVRRHEALRTRFEISEGGPVQRPEPATPFSLPGIDLSGLPSGLRAAEEERRIEEEARAPFDLARPPLLRVRLVRLGPDEHLLLLTVHHIASDAWSMGVAVGELVALYPAFAAGRPSPLPELPLQYADFAREERERLSGDGLAREVAFWRGKLAGAEPPGLPTDRPRPAVPRFGGEGLDAVLPRSLDEALRAFARERRATLFMAVLAPFSAFLARITGGDDVVLGTTVTGRGREEVARLIGFFVNTLVLRTGLAGDPEGREILARARATTLEAFTHQEIPFEKLVDELGLPRDPHRPPLLRFVLQLLSLPRTDLALPGLAITPRPLPHEAAKFDLLVNVADAPGGLRLEWRYDTDLFDGTTIARLSRSFEVLLAGLVEDPERRLSDLPLLAEAERHQLAVEWNEGAVGDNGRFPIHPLFEAQVDRAPDAVAVSQGPERLTYRELDVRANRLARHLVALGVRPGDLVALLFARSLGMIEAILATLKAGAGYLPLDPAYPEERRAFALADSDARIVLSQERVEAEREAIAARSGERLALPAHPELPAYVIYTSGSTGRPKGVVIPHGNVTRLFAATAPWLGFGPDDVWTLFHSYAFDFSVWEIWGALLHGGRLVVVPYWETRSPRAFLELLRVEKVTVLNQTPSAFRQLLWADEMAPELPAKDAAPPALAPEDPRNESGDPRKGSGDLGNGSGNLGNQSGDPGSESGDLRKENGNLRGGSGDLRYVIFGGEALEPGSLIPWMERHGDERPYLINMYGITETTVHVTYRRLRREDVARGSVIGRPIPDLSLHVLDRSLRPQPIGVPGEICVGGQGLALGYLGRPELTAERFVPDPFGPPGARLYRSGDLARRLPDGDVEYLGRIDHQVKIRGFRIEPGEIEAALARHPAVRESVVAVRGDRLVAWIVPGPEGSPSLGDLRAFLAGSLPEPMLPGALAVLDSLPLTANGKVDRRALPDPGAGPAPERGHRPPGTELERFLAGLFAEVLRLPPDRPVGLDDDFFELGGTSITGAILVNRLQEALSEAVQVAVIFDASTVARLAAFVAERHPGALAARRPEGMSGPVEGPRTAPLSFSQERLWFLDRLMPGVATYNLPTPFRLRGPLDPGALARSFGEIVRRHEALRTRFEERDGTPVQVIDPPRPWPLPVVDLTGAPEEALRLTAEEAGRPFDLQTGPLLRTTLLHLSPEDHGLLVNVHHIATDGWSVQILSKELVTLYEAFATGRPSPLPELSAQYADFARWQRERLSGAELERQVDYWRARLGDDPPALDLPLDRPRPALQTYRGASVSTVLPRDLSEGIRRLGLASRASLFMTLLAGFEVLLHRQSGQDDVLVGTPVAGRVRSDVEDLIGFFLNTLVLRTDLSGHPTFRELLLRVRETAVGAYAHQEVPFEKLLGALQPERDLSRTPLFQVFFNLASFPDLGARLPGGLTVESLGDVEAESKFDLTVYAAETGDGLRLHLVYNADLFDAPRIEEMLRQYRAVLERVVEEPEARVDEIPLVTPEAAAVLPDPRAPLGDEWRGAVHELFLDRARRHPGRPAVSDPEGSWTYGELARAAEGLAARLREAGVEKGDRVAVWAHRSAPVAWAVLGTLRAGAAFVMLDPAYPAARIVEMLRLAGPRAFLQIPAAGEPPAEVEAWLRETGTWRLTLRRGGLSLPETAPSVEIGPDDLAYIAFTSGSTGVPKGILGRHGPLSHFIPWQAERFGLTEEDRYSLLSGLAHDPLQRDLFTPLATGASLAAPAPDDLLVPGRLAAWAAREGITVAHLTPALGRVLTEGELAGIPSLRWVLLVGDVLTRLDVDRLRRIAPSVTCVNLYGSTETQRAVAFHVVEDGGFAQVLPLGRGMRDVQLLVLRPAGPPALAGIGEVGEISVRSPHLAAGYLGDEAGTRERFRANPFTGLPGDRIYRTGDLGRYLPDGQVTFAGRADQQVKIRGFRIELGEIEAALGRLPGVREAVVLARQDGADPADRRLVAYVVGETAADPRQALAAKLPAYMVPSAVVLLEKMPVTPNGKVDRRALPAPEVGAGLPAGFPAHWAEPESDLERMVAEVFRDVLGVERVGLHDSFFDLGGHSLLGTSLLSRLRNRFGVELPLRALFAEPTVAGFARRIGERLRSGEPELPAPPPLVPRPREGDPPLSFAQQRLWFLDRLNPGSPFYNLGSGVRLAGPLDVARLARSLGEVVRRHEILRTGFAEVEGRPVQRIAPDLPLEIPVLDLSDLPSEVPRIAREQARVPFDLTRPGLLRVTLLRLGEGEHVLLWTIHHILSDAWSNAVLMGEVAALYTGQSLPALPVQYADFAVWQREWLSGETLERQLAYWRERLAGAPVVELPTDRPRPPVQTFRGATYRVTYGRPLLDGLIALARQREASLFMTLLAAFGVLLCRFTGQEDVVVGAPIANRAQPALERLIGFFINTLVLRTDCAGDPSFLDLLARVKETALGAYAHQDLPFEQLVEDLEPRRDLSRNPLFQVMLNLLNAPPPRVELASGLEMTPLSPTDGTALFDLQAYVTEMPEGLRIAWEHNTDLFDPGTIERLSRGFETLLAGIVATPEARLRDLPLLSPEERAQILVRWNDTAAPVPEPGTIHALFEAQAARTPDSIALVFEGEILTYAELNARANRIAHHLRSLGVGPEVLVALRFERSVPAVLAVLAVLKAGGAYLPLDPSLPAERLAWVLEDSRAALVLTDLEEAEDDTNPEPLAGPGNLAYVLYTSGSTGKPKGVAVTHRGVVNFLASVARRPGLAAEDAVLAVTTLSFDIAGYELLLPLTVGARIVLVTRETAMDGERLAAVLAAEGVTRVQVTPATWLLLLGSGWEGDSRLMALSGGEALPRELARELLPRAGSLWNFYGPTETTIWSSVHRVTEADGAIPLGLPIANTAIHLLDRRMEPVPPGVAGELYIGGAGVTRGYLRRPDLTAERFVPDPFSPGGERLYRTGDLGRRLPAGEIEFLGRADRQVKIRGFRVEPGEIEAVLAEDPAVRQAAVVLREADGDPRLVAWLVWEEGREGDPRALRERLRERVPAYMIPSAFLPLPALPLTPSGKVDRRALASREDAMDRPLPAAARFMPPRTPAEQQMAGLFAEVLALRAERVGAHDSFFELGGHSLLATRLVSRVRAAFGVDLPLRTLFEAPTVAGLTAAVLAQGRGTEEPGIRRLHATEAPLSFSQERLWFLERLTPGTATYTLATSVRLRGPLDPATLELSFAEIVRRHEALRTRFPVRAGVPVQAIDPPGRRPLPLADLSALPEPELRAESGRLAREEASRPFDLESGPVLRTVLLRLGEEEHGLLVTVHHIATDGWSQGLLLRELAVLYEAFSSGAPSPLPELPVQYADYAVWQRERLSGPVLAAQLEYWRERLGDSPPPLDLPLDRPRPAVQTFRGAAVAGALPRELSERLARLAREEGASLFMVLLAGFKLLLHRQSGQDDVLVGTPIAGRLRPEVEDLIGFFLNTLVLRTGLSGRPPFRELVRRVRETALSAYAHQDIPFERILEEIRPERDLSRTPLFQVFFNMLNLPATGARLPSGLAIEPMGGGAGDAKFDLTVYVAPGEEGIAFHLVYNADLFDEARVEELLRQYRGLLAQAVERPDAPVDRISLVTPEAVRLLPDPAAPLGDAWRGAVHALFAERARRHPERPAVTDPEGTTAYGELAYAVRRLAARLRESGVEKGDRVAIWAHRSAPLAWAVLATLEAGGAFVMLDPAYPAPRIVEMLRLAAPRAFLAVAAAGDPPPEVEAWLAEAGLACRVTLPGGGPRGARELVASLPPPVPPVEVGPDDLAYVAFTSGSTGIPKGILGRHGPLSHFLPWQAERFGLGTGDRYSLLSGLAHDPLQRDLFTPLCLGGSLAAPSFEEVATPGRLAAWMAREGITVAHLTPALGQLLTEPPGRGAEPATIPSLRWVLLVGDVLTRLDVDRIRRIAPGVICVNLYGSTETQRAVGYHVVNAGGDGMRQVLPLGRGMEDVQLLVVRPGDEPALAGIGEVGEIWVRSPHLAAGYLGDPESTGDRFRTNPWTGAPGDRVYRTGDLGRYLPDGEVTFAGRADQQVKIRGFRIEPGEIEAALGRLPGVREAVVIVRQDGPDGPETADRRLVAYVVPDPASPPAVEALREALRGRLPAYMVPSAFVLLEKLPVTPNRKVDRRALPAPEAPGAEAGFVEPGSDLERTIAEVWREVLGVERVGVRHNFFDLGGHSLLLVRLHARLQEALGRDLALVDLFNYPSIRALAEHLGRQDGGPTGLDEARSRGQRQQEAARRQRELARARRGPRRNTDE